MLRPGERLDELRRGGMKLIQNADSPCFAVDALLLADFVQPPPASSVLELGAGSGVISLLLAHKQPQCRVTGLELMPTMAEMASRSVQLNGMEQRVRIVEGDIRRAAADFGAASFDLVVSNPPYYRLGAGRPNQNELDAAARSEKYCTLDQLLDAAQTLLKVNGLLYLVYRAARTGELLGGLHSRRLCLERLRFVQPAAGREANLLLLAARKHGRGQTVVLPPLCVYQSNGCYSEEMESIYDGRTLPGSHPDR